MYGLTDDLPEECGNAQDLQLDLGTPAPGTTAGAQYYEQSGTLGWYTGVLPADLSALRSTDGVPVVLTKGTPIRVYTGKLPSGDGKFITVPNSDGQYLIEPAPSAESKYWTAYLKSPLSLALAASDEFAATDKLRQARMVVAKIDTTKLVLLADVGIDPDAFEAIGLPKLDAPPPPNATGGTPLWLVAAAGIAAALLLAALLKNDAPPTRTVRVK